MCYIYDLHEGAVVEALRAAGDTASLGQIATFLGTSVEDATELVAIAMTILGPNGGNWVTDNGNGTYTAHKGA